MALIRHNLCIILLLVLGTATYLHGRTVGDSETLTTNTVENEPGRDRTFTSQEIEEWQRNMEPKISPEANQIYGDILRENFKKGTTQTDHIKGIVNLLVLFTATRGNATEDDLRSLFHPDKKVNEVNTITSNTV